MITPHKANLVYLQREYAMPNPIIPWQECPHSNCRQQRWHNPFCENSGVDWEKVQVREWPPKHWDVDGDMHPDEYDKRQMEAE